jgi:hypothetical protein
MEGIEVETHDDTVDLLERIGNAIFSEVGISDGPLLELDSDSTPYARTSLSPNYPDWSLSIKGRRRPKIYWGSSRYLR